MGLFDQVKDTVGEGADEAVEHTEQLVGRNGEQLERLVRRLEASGLGDRVRSWIGTGPNEPIDGTEVEQVFGKEVETIADRAGIEPDEAADEIAAVLPVIVDTLTPDGTLPVPAVTAP
jgi:uncharacterized protein YidB (DUF937 family)